MIRAGALAAGAFLLSVSAPVLPCALDGGWGFDHGLDTVPHHLARGWAPAPPVALPLAAALLSPGERMAQKRDLMRARYPLLRPEAEGAPPTPQRDGAASPADR